MKERRIDIRIDCNGFLIIVSFENRRKQDLQLFNYPGRRDRNFSMSLFPFPLLWRVKFLTKKKIKNKLSFQSLRREKLDKILTLNRRKHQVTDSPKRGKRRETFAAIYKRGGWGVNRESSTLFLPLVPHFPTLARHSWLRIARVISLCVCVCSCVCCVARSGNGWESEQRQINRWLRDIAVEFMLDDGRSALRITMNQLYYKGPFAIYPLKVFRVGNGLREIRIAV